VVLVIGYNVFARTLLWPKFQFRGLRELISFGGFVTGSRILWFIYRQIDILIAGRIFSSQLLGVYSVVLQLSRYPLAKFLPGIAQIAMPAFARVQSNSEIVRAHFLKATRIYSLFIFPIFWGLLVVAPELIKLMLGEKWDNTILPLQMMCVIMPFIALNTLFAPTLIGTGRPGVNLVNVIIALTTMVPAFLIGVNWGILGICFAWIIGFGIVFLINMRRTMSVLGLRAGQYYSAIQTPFLSTIGMLICLVGIKHLLGANLPLFPTCALLVISGIITYFSFVAFLKRDVLVEVWSLLRAIKSDAA